jgi:glycosyltransferase involved in cell wall biosynthesis
MIEENDKQLILFFSSCMPRRCGIATFTQDMATAIDYSQSSLKSKFIAINDNGNKYDYSDDVIFQIDENNISDYREVARKVNSMENVRAVSIQHEFKLYGSDHGENLLQFIEEIKKPVITTFHAVLPYPSEKRRNIVRSIAEKSEHIVVMANKAIEILTEHYGLPHSKIVVIPHGIHDVPFEPNGHGKAMMGYSDRVLLTSFGLLRPGRSERSSGKGYEYVLEALPEVIKEIPNVLYLVIGMTHPKTLKAEGEKYRHSLEKRTRELGLENHVKFINEYMNLGRLLNYIKSCDIYICSPQNPHQITSGTLSYAMGCGRAVISTPFTHARGTVTPERGILVEFNDSKSISDAIIKIVSNTDLKKRMENNAYAYTRSMTWLNTADTYMKLLK